MPPPRPRRNQVSQPPPYSAAPAPELPPRLAKQIDRKLPVCVLEQVKNMKPEVRRYRGVTFDEFHIDRTDRPTPTKQMIWVRTGYLYRTQDERGQDVPIFHAEYDPLSGSPDPSVNEEAVRQNLVKLVDHWINTGDTFAITGVKLSAPLRKMAKLLDEESFRAIIIEHSLEEPLSRAVAILNSICAKCGIDLLTEEM